MSPRAQPAPDPDDLAKVIAQAKLGLDALIDEATGYQAVRPAGDLAKRYAEYGGDESDYRAPDAIPSDWPFPAEPPFDADDENEETPHDH